MILDDHAQMYNRREYITVKHHMPKSTSVSAIEAWMKINIGT